MEFIGLSFVQRPEDLLLARALINGRAAIISKIEKPSALEHLDEIIRLSDGIMVARGELGVEVPSEKVPVLQKKIIRACRRGFGPAVTRAPPPAFPRNPRGRLGFPGPTQGEG